MIFAALRDRYRRYSAGRAARTTYFTVKDQLSTIQYRLNMTMSAQERAKLLRRMADAEMTLCWVYPHGFGQTGGAGLGWAESHMQSSKLYRLLADVEYVVACNGRISRTWHFRELGDAADRLLDCMAATPDLVDRLALIDDLYDAVLPVVGDRAAASIACLT